MFIAWVTSTVMTRIDVSSLHGLTPLRKLRGNRRNSLLHSYFNTALRDP
jgi:hypothetical protein